MKRQSQFLSIVSVLGMLAAWLGPLPPAAHAAGRCYVNDNATGANNGTSWADAYTSLQAALADSCTEIWVAAGTYKPHASDRTVAFNLESNTAIYGGFAGTETLLSQRNPVTNVTTLSGDLAGNDNGPNNGSNSTYFENTYHVVVSLGFPTARLDGFTITGGHANGASSSSFGGGMYIRNASPVLANLIFNNNFAIDYGGGLHHFVTLGSSFPTWTEMTFSNNYATWGGGLSLTSTNSVALNPTLRNATFSGNSAAIGGGIRVHSSRLTLSNATFSGNSASGGGGLAMEGSNNILEMRSVTLSGNSATGSGYGGGLYLYGDVLMRNVIVANSGSGGDCALIFGTFIDASNSLIEDAASACGLSHGVSGNIVGVDPGLAALADNGGATQTLALLAESPAIDAGEDTACAYYAPVDQRGVPRPNGVHCDIGAYEYVDTLPPTVTAFSAPAFTNNFNLPITAFTATDDATVTGYQITQSSTPPAAGGGGWLAAAPTSYTVGGPDTYVLYPWVKDGVNLVSALHSPVTVTLDITVPTVLSSVRATGSPTNAASVAFVVTYSEIVTGVATNDFGLTLTGSLTGSTVTGVSGAGATYTVSVNTGTGDGTLRLNVLDDNGVTDRAGNALVGDFTAGESYAVDLVAPTVLASVRANSNPTNASSVAFVVTYSEPVTGVDTSDFDLTTTGSLSGTAVTGVSGAGATYTVSTNTGAGDGTLRLNVLDNDSVVDLVGNAQAGAFTTGQSYLVDRTAPTVLSSVRADSSPTNAASVAFVVTYSEPVTGVDTGDFNLTATGGVTGTAVTGVSGSGATYTVSTNTGTGVGTLRLNVLDNDSVMDGASNAQAGAFTTGQSYIIDKTAPTVLASTCANGDPTNAASVAFVVTYSEQVIGVDLTDFDLTVTGSVSGAAVTGVSGFGATYTVSVNTGTGEGTLRLNVLDDDSVVDFVGNAQAGAFTTGQSYTIDRTAPTVTLTSTVPNPTVTRPILVTVTFSEDVSNFGLGDIVAGNATVSNFAGSGSLYTFTLLPSRPGLVTADLAAAVAQDAAGNPNTAAPQFSRTVLVTLYLPFVVR